MAVKIFVGNIAYGTDTTQLRDLFEQHGMVSECDVLGGYGFVHMETEEVAKRAITALSGYSLNGSRLNVELSTASTQGRAKLAARATSTVKIFIGNLSKSTTNDKLRELFETYGSVAEADVLGGFGFVHMNHEQEAFKAIKSLNGYILDGSRINVELSTGGTQGKSKDHDLHGGRSSSTSMSSRLRTGGVRYDPYAVPSVPARRPIDSYSYDSYPLPASSSRASGDSFARDLLELYIKNRPAFEAYVNDPVVRKSLNLPPVEADAFYARTPAPLSSARDYFERRRLSDLPSSSSISADPYASPSDYASSSYDAMAAASGRAWPGASANALSHSAAAAKGRGNLYTSFE